MSWARRGGAKGGNAEPLPMSKDSILSCPEYQSVDVGYEGVKSTLPRDERGCVNEEVVKFLLTKSWDMLTRPMPGQFSYHPFQGTLQYVVHSQAILARSTTRTSLGRR